ncbi:hypothetical protein DPMN_055133 [Dreissena polymorpha]|uniref:Uncharacterized protein n=1 Tax=Dreissena polymorpha TaxID=45954 RepID=A0A9D4CPE6_DREPO|nr:hypothetical protein DPMN_055133 [Dreissena polymorpha]
MISIIAIALPAFTKSDPDSTKRLRLTPGSMVTSPIKSDLLLQSTLMPTQSPHFPQPTMAR